MIRKVQNLPAFRRDYRNLPQDTKELVGTKLALYIADPNHPSLRVKKIKGTSGIWELSLTMNYRLTFEVSGEVMTLRRVGTHDILRSP